MRIQSREAVRNARRERFDFEDMQARNLDRQITEFKRLSHPLQLKEVSGLKDLCFTSQNAISDGDSRDRLLLRYKQVDGLEVLASKLPAEELRGYDQVLLHRRRYRGRDPGPGSRIKYSP